MRSFTIDDGHIICRPEQIQSEITDVIDLIRTTYAEYGFKDYRIELSTRPEKSIGSDEVWEAAEARSTRH